MRITEKAKNAALQAALGRVCIIWKKIPKQISPN